MAKPASTIAGYPFPEIAYDSPHSPGLVGMPSIRDLLSQIACAEAQLQSTQFVAPCVQGGRIRTRVAGLVYTFKPQPRSFAGWGVFQVMNDHTAKLVEAADLDQVMAYLSPLPCLRLRLAYALQDQTWLAYPVNESDMRQRFQRVQPIPVHLVEAASPFEQIVSRWDGNRGWFESVDRRADPAIAEILQGSLQAQTPIHALTFKGMTPELRSLYGIVVQNLAQNNDGFSQNPDENRLQQALHLGGGGLEQFQDRGEYWTVDWTTADGSRHTSAIAKDDLTVISSGICLSGRDRDFDLQSLVGVLEHQDE